MTEKAAALPPKVLAGQAFGRRLEALMVERGWNQSEMARQASKHVAPLQKPIGRDLISVYIRGKSKPGPNTLAAIAKALKIAPHELLPNGMASGAENVAPTFEMREMPNEPGICWLSINRTMSFKKALEIMRVLDSKD